VPFLELHSDKTRPRPGATCQSNQKSFHPFQCGNIKLLTIVDHRGLLEVKKTARNRFGCEQWRPKFTPTVSLG